jgi:hypothetical protein
MAKIYKYILPLSTSGNGVICKNAKMALNLSDVIHDEIGLNLKKQKKNEKRCKKNMLISSQQL